jgi:hypothetical protein
MARHDPASLTDQHLLIPDLHCAVVAHQCRRHAVPIAIHWHGAVLGDTMDTLIVMA